MKHASLEEPTIHSFTQKIKHFNYNHKIKIQKLKNEIENM